MDVTYLLLIIVYLSFSEYYQRKQMVVIFKSIDADPKLYLSPRIIKMIKDGEDQKALKEIKKQTGFTLEVSKDIFMKVKWNLAKESE